MSTMSAAGGEMRASVGATVVSSERIGAVSGIVFVVLVLIATFIAPIPPKASDSVEKITAYFADHRAVLLTATYINGLALLPAILFIATLYAMLRQAEGAPGRVAIASFAGAILTAALATASGVIVSALAFTGRDADGPVVRGLFNLYQVVSTFSWFPQLVWLLPASLLMLKMPRAYRWVAWLGLLECVLALLAGASVARSGLFALGGVLNLIAFLVFALWVLATSIVMLRQPSGQ